MLQDRLELNRWRRERSKSREITDNWEYVRDGRPDWKEDRDLSFVEQSWEDWLREENPASLKQPNIRLRPGSLHAIDRIHGSDPQKVPGNLIQRNICQMDLFLRRGDMAIDVLEGNIEDHPATREFSLKWGSMKLKGPGNHNNHESNWNVQFHLWAVKGRITIGLTNHGENLDKSGNQITHTWVQYSGNASSATRAFIADFLLNVSGYGCFFAIKMPPPARWKPKMPPVAQPSTSSGEPPCCSERKSVEVPSPPQLKGSDQTCSKDSPATHAQVGLETPSSAMPFMPPPVARTELTGFSTGRGSQTVSSPVKVCPQGTMAHYGLPLATGWVNRPAPELPAVAIPVELPQSAQQPFDFSCSASAGVNSGPYTSIDELDPALMDALTRQAFGDGSLEPGEYGGGADFFPAPALAPEAGGDFAVGQSFYYSHVPMGNEPPGFLLPGLPLIEPPGVLLPVTHIGTDVSQLDIGEPCVQFGSSDFNLEDSSNPEGLSEPPAALNSQTALPAFDSPSLEPAPEPPQDDLEPVALVRCKNPAKGPRLSDFTQETRATQRLSHDSDWSDDFKNAVARKASTLVFPAEASNEKPNGPYADWLYRFLDACGRQWPVNPPAVRDFVARTSHDAILLKDMMCIMLADNWESSLQKIPDSHRNAFRQWREKLLECLQTKPDPAYLGFKKLSQRGFEERYRGDLALYLHSLFEARHGEAIEVQHEACHDVSHPGVPNPNLVAMHHPQLYTQAHRNEEQRKAKEASQEFFSIVRKNRYPTRTKRFLNEIKSLRCANAVFRPIGGSGNVSEIRMTYHTLPSLVWECCDQQNLLELYTYFCAQPLFLSKAKHSFSKQPKKTKSRSPARNRSQ
jgi:hypothetical protein